MDNVEYKIDSSVIIDAAFTKLYELVDKVADSESEEELSKYSDNAIVCFEEITNTVKQAEADGEITALEAAMLLAEYRKSMDLFASLVVKQLICIAIKNAGKHYEDDSV